MKSYYVNKEAQANGDHEVHVDGCTFMPTNKKYLGEYTDCKKPVEAALKDYLTANGCYYCCNSCHTR